MMSSYFAGCARDLRDEIARRDRAHGVHGWGRVDPSNEGRWDDRQAGQERAMASLWAWVRIAPGIMKKTREPEPAPRQCEWCGEQIKGFPSRACVTRWCPSRGWLASKPTSYAGCGFPSRWVGGSGRRTGNGPNLPDKGMNVVRSWDQRVHLTFMDMPPIFKRWTFSRKPQTKG